MPQDQARPEADEPVSHPAAVEADVIVRIVPADREGGPAHIDPMGGRPQTTQPLRPDIRAQISGRYGYFRARWDGRAWRIGDALPREEWPEE